MATGLNEGRNISRGINDGAAQVFDFTPLIRQTQNLYAIEERKRQMAQKLYEETVAQYDPKRQKLRQADVPAYLQDYQEWAGYQRTLSSGKERDPIRRAEIQAAADRIAGRMQQRVAKSLQQEEFEKGMAQALWSNPDNFEDYTPEVLAAMRGNPVENIEANNLQGVDYSRVPIAGAPDVRNIGLYASRPFDPNKLSRWNETAKTKEVQYDGNGKFREIETETLKLSPEQIIKDAHTWFTSDRAAARSFAKEFKADQENGTYEDVVETFYEKYPAFKGKPIAEPATYKAIKHLASVEPKRSESEWKFTDDKRFENQKQLAFIQNALFMGRQEEADNRLEEYISSIEADAAQRGVMRNNKLNGQLTPVGMDINLSPDLAAALSVPNEDGTRMLKPNVAVLKPDGNWLVTIYETEPKLNADGSKNPAAGKIKRDANGNPKIAEQQEFTRTQVKGNLNKYFSGKVPKQVTQPKQAQPKAAPQQKKYKYSATGADGKKAFSNDGVNWVDANGNPVK